MFSPPDTHGAEITILFPTDTGPAEFVFQTRVLPGAVWERMLLEHRTAEEGFDYDPTTFPPAVLAESIVGGTTPDGPFDEFTAEHATEIWETWPAWARRELLRPIELQNAVGTNLGKALAARNAAVARARNDTEPSAT